jgi:hypothetical protein
MEHMFGCGTLSWTCKQVQHSFMMTSSHGDCGLANRFQPVLSRNTCLAGQGDNDGVEAHCAQCSEACEETPRGGAVGPSTARGQGSIDSIIQAASKPRNKFCSSRIHQAR